LGLSSWPPIGECTEVKIDGVEYLIMKESDIMGVLLEAEVKKKAA
jgi:chaperonin GroES